RHRIQTSSHRAIGSVAPRLRPLSGQAGRGGSEESGTAVRHGLGGQHGPLARAYRPLRIDSPPLQTGIQKLNPRDDSDGGPVPLQGVEVALHEAGHIPGAASVEIRWKENNRRGSLVFSDNLKRPNRPILRDPTPLARADYLVTEGTYGGKHHPEEASLRDSLGRVVLQALERGGRIIIPAFAVGRTQEVVYALDKLFLAGRVPEVP